VLVVVKPAGPTSHDVVDQVRQALGTRRVGHLGTLDPFAEGVLVVVVGRATRLAPFTTAWRKSYEGVIRLGVATTTDDGTGEVVSVSDAWRRLRREDVEAALARFRGSIRQRPPAHSAVKVAGERAYRRARRGETVELSERPAEIFALELTGFAPPDVRFRATVSGGTYLRSLARDLGAELGCGAHLAVLTRTAVGPFGLEQGTAPEAVTAEHLQPMALLVSELPRRALSEAERDAVRHGRTLPARAEQDRVALFAREELVAIGERVGDVVKPRVVMVE
jgi:tRNA pseudouridine55 synthase